MQAREVEGKKREGNAPSPGLPQSPPAPSPVGRETHGSLEARSPSHGRTAESLDTEAAILIQFSKSSTDGFTPRP